MELLTLLEQLLTLKFEVLSFTVHNSLELLEMPQLDLELLKLSLDEQRNGALDLPLLVERELSGLDRRSR